MDQKEFENKLSEVAEWQRERHQGQSQDSQGRNIVHGTVPTYIVIKQLKDRPCPYNPNHKNCDITIKATANDGIYFRRCRTCQGVIVKDQWHDGSKVKDTAKFTERLLTRCEEIKNEQTQSETKTKVIETEQYIIRINPTESLKL